MVPNNTNSQVGMQLHQSPMQTQSTQQQAQQPIQNNSSTNYQTTHHPHQEVAVQINSSQNNGVNNAGSAPAVNAPGTTQQHDTPGMPPLWNSDMSHTQQVQLQYNMMNAYHYAGQHQHNSH